jgi:Flp pilus assembly pilin Flp
MNSIVAVQTKLHRLIRRLSPGQAANRIARAQTMTEYALILAAVAIVAYVTYQTLGTDIKTLVSSVATDLSNAANN